MSMASLVRQSIRASLSFYELRWHMPLLWGSIRDGNTCQRKLGKQGTFETFRSLPVRDGQFL
jgi:hypothetical protein